jgi:general secretion pathway protein F
VDQIEHQYFKSVWSEVRQRVSEGLSFGNALAEHTLVFSGLYINMVRAGESSGALDVVLNRLADFTESQAQLRSKLRSTMVYPIFIMIVASGVMVILFVFVIPKLAALFEAQKVPLPMVTQLLISFSQFLSHWWYVVFPFIGLIIWGFRRYIDSPRGRPWWDGVVLNMPIFGPVVRMVAIARFCKTLGTLIASGVPILGAFDIVKNVVQNVVLIEVIEITRDSVKEGDTIAAALKRSGQFPPIVTHMIAIGERSGQLEQMLQNIANSYEVQVDASLRAMTSVLEPLMMVIMGIVVAFIILSVLLPMLQLSSLA